MRFLVLALMIALLPLRVWAGEVMATEMASSQIVRIHKQTEYATELVAVRSRIHWANNGFDSKKTAFEAQKPTLEARAAITPAMHDCDGHVKTDESAPANAHCNSCSACQVCHTAALSTSAVILNPAFAPRTLPRAVAAQFASATPALGQKPPIS